MAKRRLRHFGDRDLSSSSTEDIQGFLAQSTAACANHTKRARFSFVTALFNYVRDNLDHTAQNPCVSPSLRRQFRPRTARSWKALDKDVVGEMVFKTRSERDRLMLELMVSAGRRVGEVLKLTMPTWMGRNSG